MAMQLLPHLVVTLLLLTDACLAQVTPMPKANIRECYDRIRMQDANLIEIVECMAQSLNVTAQYEDTVWKMELLDRRVDQLLKQPEPERRPSPYVHIDDVLQIEGSVAGYDCQRKRHLVQAIRRKLEMYSLLSDQESTLFDWPKPMEQAPSNSTHMKWDLVQPPLRSKRQDVEELRCLIVMAISEQP